MPDPIRVEVQGGSQQSPPPPSSGGGGVLFFLPGLAFIGLGILVIFVPEILIAMVSGAFFVIGLGLLFGAMAFRRAKSRLSTFAQFRSFGGP